MTKPSATTDPSAPQLCVGLMRSGRELSQSLARALADAGLSGPAFALLDHLDKEGPASQLELARSLGVHPSNVVRAVDQLEEAGLLVRRRDPSDRRRQVVGLTARGGEKLTQARSLAHTVEVEFFEGLDAAERRKLARMFARLAERSCDRGRC